MSKCSIKEYAMDRATLNEINSLDEDWRNCFNCAKKTFDLFLMIEDSHKITNLAFCESCSIEVLNNAKYKALVEFVKHQT